MNRSVQYQARASVITATLPTVYQDQGMGLQVPQFKNEARINFVALLGLISTAVVVSASSPVVYQSELSQPFIKERNVGYLLSNLSASAANVVTITDGEYPSLVFKKENLAFLSSNSSANVINAPVLTDAEYPSLHTPKRNLNFLLSNISVDAIPASPPLVFDADKFKSDYLSFEKKNAFGALFSQIGHLTPQAIVAAIIVPDQQTIQLVYKKKNLAYVSNLSANVTYPFSFNRPQTQIVDPILGRFRNESLFSVISKSPTVVTPPVITMVPDNSSTGVILLRNKKRLDFLFIQQNLLIHAIPPLPPPVDQTGSIDYYRRYLDDVLSIANSGGTSIPVTETEITEFLSYYRRYLDDVASIASSSGTSQPVDSQPTTELLEYLRRYLNDVS